MDHRFEALLLEYVNTTVAHERAAIQETLWREYGATKAVFVMDMSGFSRLTQRYGIVHYLSMVKRMQLTTQPIVEKNGGQVVKFEADNCFAMFDSVLPAMETAFELNHVFDEMNEYTDEPFDIRISIGIDYGSVLLIGGPDYFGDAVNRASKLGEDVAGPGEIFMTHTAYRLLPSGIKIDGEHLDLTLSGIKLDAVKLINPG